MDSIRTLELGEHANRLKDEYIRSNPHTLLDTVRETEGIDRMQALAERPESPLDLNQALQELERIKQELESSRAKTTKARMQLDQALQAAAAARAEAAALKVRLRYADSSMAHLSSIARALTPAAEAKPKAAAKDKGRWIRGTWLAGLRDDPYFRAAETLHARGGKTQTALAAVEVAIRKARSFEGYLDALLLQAAILREAAPARALAIVERVLGRAYDGGLAPLAGKAQLARGFCLVSLPGREAEAAWCFRLAAQSPLWAEEARVNAEFADHRRMKLAHDDPRRWLPVGFETTHPRGKARAE